VIDNFLGLNISVGQQILALKKERTNKTKKLQHLQEMKIRRTRFFKVKYYCRGVEKKSKTVNKKKKDFFLLDCKKEKRLHYCNAIVKQYLSLCIFFQNNENFFSISLFFIV
jgi:phage regulator Rha-like protein